MFSISNRRPVNDSQCGLSKVSKFSLSWATKGRSLYPSNAKNTSNSKVEFWRRLNAIRMDHFSVACIIVWSVNEREAGVDIVSIETCCFSYVSDAVLVLIKRNLHKKRIEVSIKTWSTSASLSFKCQATKHTNVKWFNSTPSNACCAGQ